MKNKRIMAIFIAGFLTLSQGMVNGEELSDGDMIELNEVVQDESVLEEDKEIISGVDFEEEDTGKISEVTPVNAGNYENISIDTTRFPDEGFRNYVRLNFDNDHDSFLSNYEVARVEKLTICYWEIESLKGIEVFTNLKSLECWGNKLRNLDLSHNTALVYLSCYNNNLTSLDLSHNTALKSLKCDRNNLISLELSHNTALISLDCDANKLVSLNVCNNILLSSLDCSVNNLTSLDLSHNTALTSLSASYNNLTRLDLSHNTALNSLNCNDNNLSSLDLSSNTALTILNCGSNNLSSLNLSNNTALTMLSCGSNKLTSLDLSFNTALKWLSCVDNKLTSLNISNNTALVHLDCHKNNLTSLDVDGNVLLDCLSVSDNGFSITSPFNLSTLPGSFDISKASNWQGGTVDGPILTATQDIVTYDYNCGEGYTVKFVLNVISSVTPTPTPTPAQVMPTAWTGNEQIKDLKATSTVEGTVLTWLAYPGANGYLIGAIQNGNSYKQIDFIIGGNNTRYVDTNASLTTYSYYWVFPYKQVNGKVIRGAVSSTYVYGIKQLPAPTNLTSTGVKNGVSLKWSFTANADGFIIKRRIGSSGNTVVIADVTGTSYIDMTASKTDNSFYWVYAYKKSGNYKIPGEISNYVYAKAK